MIHLKRGLRVSRPAGVPTGLRIELSFVDFDCRVMGEQGETVDVRREKRLS